MHLQVRKTKRPAFQRIERAGGRSYQQVADNLRVKEVRISDADRFMICDNPEQADRDAAMRQRLLAQLKETIAGTNELPATKRAELRGVISTNRLRR
jgi:hypothetical protein